MKKIYKNMLIIFLLFVVFCILFLLFLAVVGKGHKDKWGTDIRQLDALSVGINMYKIDYGEFPPEGNFKQLLLERKIIDSEDRFYSDYGNLLIRYFRNDGNFVLVSPGKNGRYDTPEGYQNIRNFRGKTDDIVKFN